MVTCRRYASTSAAMVMRRLLDRTLQLGVARPRLVGGAERAPALLAGGPRREQRDDQRSVVKAAGEHRVHGLVEVDPAHLDVGLLRLALERLGGGAHPPGQVD